MSTTARKGPLGKINSLTPAQEDALRAAHAEWYAYGTSTEPSDRPATEAAIARMYEIIGRPAPAFIWCDSPATGALMVALLSGKLTAKSDSLRDSLRGSLRGSLGGSLWGSLGGSLGGSLRGSLNRAWWGQHESAWIAFYLFPEQQELVTYDPKRSEQLGLWATISRSTGWWFPYEGVVVCTDRPVEVRQETVRASWPYGVTSRRLHCEDGPALAYRDGWAVHAWHGVRVPAWVIEDDITPDHIDRALKIDNSEIRRAALERISWPTVVQHLGPQPIATCPDPANFPHELALYALPPEFYEEPVNLLVMTNGSPDRSGDLRLYGETCPANITDPLEAASWQYGVPADVYRQLERRT